jgi:hypothetical protein
VTGLRPTILLVCAVALVAGCGTTTKSGHVGDTFSGGGLKVTVERVELRPPAPGDDVTGLSSPAPGNRLIAARVRVCNKYDFAVGTYDFGLSLDGGGEGTVKFPQMNYADGFDHVRTGCARGWIVFELPSSRKPSKIHFAYDDTGSGGSNMSGRPESHERFSWSVT